MKIKEKPKIGSHIKAPDYQKNSQEVTHLKGTTQVKSSKMHFNVHFL